MKPLAYLGAALALAGGLGLVLLVLADIGALNRVIPGAFQLATHRTLAFRRLDLHLLQSDPTLVFDDLVIGSPPRITREDVAHVAHGELHAELLPLFVGRLVLTEVALTGANLDLVRQGHGRTNYSFGGAGMSATLHAVTRMTIQSSRVRYTDPERQLTLDAAASYDSASGDRPLHLAGGGVDHGEPYTVEARGAPLTRRDPASPYAFDVGMTDGQANAVFSGASQKPFDFRGFDLQFTARGPNMTDLGYLFGITVPNSPPFALTAHVKRVGHVVRYTDIHGRIGQSEVVGDFTADHSRPHRRLSAQLHAKTLRVSDLAVLFTRRASHAEARGGPTAAPTLATVATDRPIDSQGLRTVDVHLDIRADRVEGGPLALANARMRLDLEDGRLVIDPFEAALAPGALELRADIDARSAAPAGRLVGSITGVRIERLAPTLAKQVGGDLDAKIDISGQGATTRALVAGAHGAFGFRIKDGRVNRSAAAALAGDPLHAGWTALVDKSGDVSLSCARGRFDLRNGVATPSMLTVRTSEGDAAGSGWIDLAAERLDMIFGSAAAPGRRPALSAPVHLTGALAHPKAEVDLQPAVNRAGLGAIGALIAAPFQDSPRTGGRGPCPPPV